MTSADRESDDVHSLAMCIGEIFTGQPDDEPAKVARAERMLAKDLDACAAAAVEREAILAEFESLARFWLSDEGASPNHGPGVAFGNKMVANQILDTIARLRAVDVQPGGQGGG